MTKSISEQLIEAMSECCSSWALCAIYRVEGARKEDEDKANKKHQEDSNAFVKLAKKLEEDIDILNKCYQSGKDNLRSAKTLLDREALWQELYSLHRADAIHNACLPDNMKRAARIKELQKQLSI